MVFKQHAIGFSLFLAGIVACSQPRMDRAPMDDVRIPFNVAQYLRDDAEVTADEARLIADIAAHKPVSKKFLTRVLTFRFEAYPQEKIDFIEDAEVGSKKAEKPGFLVFQLFRTRLHSTDFGTEFSPKN